MDTAVGPADTPLPSGRVVFLFTDIEGSTRRWEAYGDEMRRCVTRYEQLSRDCVTADGGVVVKSLGDGTMAAFTSVDAAIRCAVTLQRRLHAENWSPVPPLTARMGVHVGSCEPVLGDYFGVVVNRAARLSDAANGGQILVSDTAMAALSPFQSPTSDHSFRSRGHHQLKDLAEPMEIHEVVVDDLPAVSRPLRTIDPTVRRLPVQRSVFLGREDEVRIVVEALRTERIVTLAGVGGVGKTRLAVHACAEMAGTFDGDIHFVDLSGVVAGDDLASAVVSHIAAAGGGTGRSAHDVLVDACGRRPVLMVLDNCDQVVDGAAGLVSSLLDRCPSLRVMVTSREPLRVGGERVVRVDPLPRPAATGDGRTTHDPAVELFVARAIAAGAPAPGAGDLTHIERVCELVDRLPFAIELAAARATHLPLEDLADRIEQHYDVLSTRQRDRSGRHRTVDGMLSWSWDLLDVTEQALFQRMAVFAAPVAVAQLETVVCDDLVPRRDVLEAVSVLVDHSLVLHDPTTATFRMLSLVRRFADATLEDDERRRFEIRHADWCIRALDEQIADEALPALVSRSGADLHTALARAVHRGDTPRARALAGRMWRVFEVEGGVADGVSRLAEVVAMAPLTTVDDARASLGLANLLLSSGDAEGAVLHHRTAESLFASMSDDGGAAWARLGQAMAALQIGDPAGDAAAMASRARATFAAVGDEHGVGSCDVALGLIAAREQRHADAELAYLAALSAFRLGHQRAAAAAVLANLGNLASDAGDLLKATRFLDGAAQLYRELGNRRGEGLILNNLCLVARSRGDLDRSFAYADDARAALEAAGDLQGAAVATVNRANLFGQRVAAEQAIDAYRDAIDLFRRAADARGVLVTLSNLSAFAWQHGLRRAAWSAEVDRAMILHRLGLRAGLAEALTTLSSRAAEVGDPELAATLGVAALDGGAVVDAALVQARQFGIDDAVPAVDVGSPVTALSRREHELLVLVGNGFTNQEIASTMFVSLRTVDAHLSHIRTKLGVTDRVKLALLGQSLSRSA